MLKHYSQLPDEVQIATITRRWVAICPETGAYLSPSRGRTSQAPKYVLILPNQTVEERGGWSVWPTWNDDERKFLRAWSDEEAIELANKKLEKMLAKRQSVKA